MLKLKAVETKMSVGIYMGQYRYILKPEIYSTLSDKKVIEEAAIRSGVSRGILQAAWEAISNVISAWATEGHSVAIPGLGTMRFGVNATSVADVNAVASNLITSRKVIFTPNVDIKSNLKATAVNITCYDRNGNIVKRVNSTNDSVEDASGEYTLALSCDSLHGTVIGAGTYSAGESVQISASPASGYEFVQWSDGITSATRNVVVNSNMSLTATFRSTGSGSGGGGSNVVE